MKFFLYGRLAIDGIRKNKKLYFPYILTCIGMVMMAYILQSLSYSPALRQMKGGSDIEIVLSLGKLVVTAFAVLFLLYTNSFLIRRRYREFGLYNVLGMGKGALGLVILWESVIVAALGLVFGLGLGILLSKLAELGLVNAVHGQVDYRITLSWECIQVVLILFVPIFGVLAAKSLFQVYRTNPLALLSSEAVGEKPPKANYLLALSGIALLGGAYYISVTIRSPLRALVLFFVAVIMVIVATYLLCISGSVTLCRFLQGRKRFYYQKNHFVSLSTMVYRMKRNGAGLASICILSTMVLVMLTSTFSLYLGAEDSIQTRCPNDVGIAVVAPDLELGQEEMDTVRDTFASVLAQWDVTPTNVQEYRYAAITGLLVEDCIEPDAAAFAGLLDYDNLRVLFFIPQEDYNRCTGENIALSDGQAMVYCLQCQYDYPTFSMGNTTLEIVGELSQKLPIGEAESSVAPAMLMVVADWEQFRPLGSLADFRGDAMLIAKLYCGFDVAGLSDSEILQLYSAMEDSIYSMKFLQNGNGSYAWNSQCRAEERSTFYSLFGGLFFLGIVLSILFSCAAVLIIYYKQICEGYEDQSHYAILRKVGMTKENIRKDVNSQILTVFFVPPILAGIHLAFAFPIVWKLLQVFYLRNLHLVIRVNILVFLLFCLFYGIVYKFTAGAYYGIVSGSKRE